MEKIKEFIDKKLNKYKDKQGNYFIPLNNYYRTLIKIKSMLDELDKPRYIMDDEGNISRLDGWVDVKDGLPRENGTYFVTSICPVVMNPDEPTLVQTMEYKNKKWVFGIKEIDRTNLVIAWKPLPQPYKRKGVDNE